MAKAALVLALLAFCLTLRPAASHLGSPQVFLTIALDCDDDSLVQSCQKGDKVGDKQCASAPCTRHRPTRTAQATCASACGTQDWPLRNSTSRPHGRISTQDGTTDSPVPEPQKQQELPLLIAQLNDIPLFAINLTFAFVLDYQAWTRLTQSMCGMQTLFQLMMQRKAKAISICIDHIEPTFPSEALLPALDSRSMLSITVPLKFVYLLTVNTYLRAFVFV